MKHLEIDTNHSCRRVAVAILIFFSFALGAQNPLGEEFFSLDPEPVTGQSFGPVTSLALSPSDGSLWIGTEDGGILRIGRKGNRIHYSVASGHLSSDSVKEMCFISSSVLYILYENGGLARYSSTQGFSDVSLFNEGISHILKHDGSDMLLCSTQSGGIYTVDVAGATALVQAVNEPVAVLSTALDGSIYFVGEKSRIVKQIANDGIQDKTTEIPDMPTSLLAAADGVFWVGTGQGLYGIDGISLARYTATDGFPSNRIYSIVEDAPGSILIATASGVVGLNVSKTNVSDSKLYFPDETYLCSYKTNGPEPVCFFGGNRGIAVLTSESRASELPWNDINDTVYSNDFNFPGRINLVWIIPLVVIVGAVSFVLGRRKHKGRSDDNYTKTVEIVPLPPKVVPSSVKNASTHNDLPEHPVHHPLQASDAVAAPAPVAAPSPVTVKKPAPAHSDNPKVELRQVIDRLNDGDAPAFSVKVWNMIEESYTDPQFSVETIATRLLLSRVHVNRKLQQEVGVSPSALIKAKRMAAARELLLAGGMTLPQVAHKAGFSSAAYLSASFKDYFGHSPSELMHTS